MTTTAATSVKQEVEVILAESGVPETAYSRGSLTVRTPITGEVIAHIPTITVADAAKAIEQAHAAFFEWRNVPAPKRGELVRLLGEELRANIEPLGGSSPSKPERFSPKVAAKFRR